MKKIGIINIYAALLLLVAGTAINVSAQIRPYRVTNAQVRSLLVRIETKTDTFQRQMNGALDRSRLDGSDSEELILDYITQFENATDRLRRQIDARAVINDEVNEVLTRGAYIDQFMQRNRLALAAENQWVSIRTDLNTLARYYRLTWSWNQTLPTYPNVPGGVIVPNTRIRPVLVRIETRTDTFRNALGRALDRSTLNNTQSENEVLEYVGGFEAATDRLRARYDSNQDVSSEVSEVLTRATYIDQFMNRNRLAAGAENQWINLRTDLNTLASYSNVSWNWNRTLPPWSTGFPSTGFPAGNLDNRLTGTYRLNTSRSDNVSQVVQDAIERIYSGTQRTRVQRNLERRLGSPEMIAIEARGRNITLASSLSPQVSFDATGVTTTETNARGRTTRVTATAESDGFVIDYVGDRANDFRVDFEAVNNNQLRVTRRVYIENRNETVTVNSFYDKIDGVARWSDVNSGGVWDGGNTGGNINDFIIPNGTRLNAELRNMVSTEASQVGDRFSMEVTSPSQYRGAIIEGRIAAKEASGRLTGRAELALEFDTIRYNNRSYRFAGIIDSVRAPNGETVSINNEGVVREGNQTTRTVTRAGIGAAIGAIIGAIAGGGTGAAIGAGVGAGAGAGSILIQGRDNIELGVGTDFAITASAPANLTGSNR